jgi:hypothetical protein
MIRSNNSTAEGATLKPGDFRLCTLASRAAARALLEAKKQDPNIIHLTCYGRDPNLAPEFLSSFTDKAGQSWEVWVQSGQKGNEPLKGGYPCQN